MAKTHKNAAWLDRFGPWAVITGASDGIGLAIAEECARRGLNLVLVSRRETVLAHLADRLQRQHSIRTLVIAADLADSEALQHVLDATRNIDCGLLVCAAGFGTGGAFLELDADIESNMIDVNCRAVYLLAREFGARMAKAGHGGIVLLSSIVAFQGVARSANYAATKAYVQTLAEGMRIELLRRGVEVLAVAPGPVASGFADRADIRMGNAEKPGNVARGALGALGRTGLVRPGLLSKVLGYSLATLPRFLRRSIMSSIMAGMTDHQKATKI